VVIVEGSRLKDTDDHGRSSVLSFISETRTSGLFGAMPC
jgi:hypothetical protein